MLQNFRYSRDTLLLRYMQQRLLDSLGYFLQLSLFSQLTQASDVRFLIILLPMLSCIFGVIGTMSFVGLPLTYRNSASILLILAVVTDLAITWNIKKSRVNIVFLLLWFAGLLGIVALIFIFKTNSYILQEVFMPLALFMFFGLCHEIIFVQNVIMIFVKLHPKPGEKDRDEVDLVENTEAEAI